MSIRLDGYTLSAYMQCFMRKRRVRDHGKSTSGQPPCPYSNPKFLDQLVHRRY
jgi:hypothetical protein